MGASFAPSKKVGFVPSRKNMPSSRFATVAAVRKSHYLFPIHFHEETAPTTKFALLKMRKFG
jgi:hypothetical protein